VSEASSGQPNLRRAAEAEELLLTLITISYIAEPWFLTETPERRAPNAATGPGKSLISAAELARNQALEVKMGE
jgi:hypothetical protein